MAVSFKTSLKVLGVIFGLELLQLVLAARTPANTLLVFTAFTASIPAIVLALFWHARTRRRPARPGFILTSIISAGAFAAVTVFASTPDLIASSIAALILLASWIFIAQAVSQGHPV